jgi:hypothetical protein
MTEKKPALVHLPAALHLQSRFFAASAGLWCQLGKLETAVLGDELHEVEVRKPVYVSGLARSGTTILTEMLERHAELTSHRYSDFPNIWTPYWRNYLLQKTRKEQPVKHVRAHQDRIEVSNDSPEAVEEVLWRHFFPKYRAGMKTGILDEQISNPEFETFYHDHIRKLLLVRNSPRYLAKGNYNLTRLLYILKLFPDARFLIPYRNPVNHIASLIKQHRFFLQAHAEDPRISQQLAFSGHFEFGALRSAIHFGDEDLHRGIIGAWAGGREAEGWALYWAQTYRFLLDQLHAHPELEQASLFCSYEALCNQPQETIDRILVHCDLNKESFRNIRQYYCEHLTLPDYYQPDFTSGELEIIERVCGPVVSKLDARFG